ncbi:MAG: P1 family peptidase [Candidatus Adiutricales bacterium]
MRTNDNTSLKPVTTFSTPVLEFDFSGFQIGVAEYDEGPTGCTVFYFPEGAATAIDIRGGTVGSIGNHPWNHALCLAGGSFYGLEAAAGVAAEIFIQKNYRYGFNDIARVSGAVIYDYQPRDNVIYPDKELGRAAMRSVQSNVFPLGARGAGRSATVGKGLDFNQGEPAGQGGAFRLVGPVKMAVFTVVSAIGAVVDRRGRILRGHLDRKTGRRNHLHEILEKNLTSSGPTEPPQGNTTLTVLITSQKMDPATLNQIARQVHGSMARAIAPFHTIYDGDVLYAVTTNEVEHKSLGRMAFGTLAEELAWDAVLSAVNED